MGINKIDHHGSSKNWWSSLTAKTRQKYLWNYWPIRMQAAEEIDHQLSQLERATMAFYIYGIKVLDYKETGPNLEDVHPDDLEIDPEDFDD